MNFEEIDFLRPVSALRLLTIWRESGRETEDPMERGILCNARILAECCVSDGNAAFADTNEVLNSLTGRQMETLLRRLSDGEAPPSRAANPVFDQTRFQALKEE